MESWTGIEIENARKGLEHASATVLGRMLFEFSRLDMQLGLFLVWSNEGRDLEMLTREVGDLSFHKKLDKLKNLAKEKYSATEEANTAYGQWLDDSHTTRLRRNELVHGRWGVDPINSQVINVVGLPTSSEQREVRYSIKELKSALVEMQSLQARLHDIREKWPV